MKVSELPAVVVKAINNQFPGYQIKDANLNETPQRVAYEIDIKKGDSEKEITISKTGKVLKTEKGGEDND
jgi:uncharacterized membrane protein YkoI